MLRLRRDHAWLIRVLPETSVFAGQLQTVLADPRMAELLAAAPKAGRILRPLCRMLGIMPPGALALPSDAGKVAPRPRTVKAAPPTALALICEAARLVGPLPAPAPAPSAWRRIWLRPP